MTDQAAVSRNPATGEEIERFPFQTEAEVEELLGQANDAFLAWRRVPVAERA